MSAIKQILKTQHIHTLLYTHSNNKTKEQNSNKTKEGGSDKTKEEGSNKTKEGGSNKTKEKVLPFKDNNSTLFYEEESLLKESERMLRPSNAALCYDVNLFHKTIFHLQPMRDNPEVFRLMGDEERRKVGQTGTMANVIAMPSAGTMPSAIAMHKGEGQSTRFLSEDTLQLITAKRWLLYSVKGGSVLKGFKYRKVQPAGMAISLLVFHTAYSIVRQHFLQVGNVQLLIHKQQSQMGEWMQNQDLITLEDALYLMLMNSQSAAALILANNLGHYLRVSKLNTYFSCFDVTPKHRNANLNTFSLLMEAHAKELNLSDFKMDPSLTTCTASALDCAKMMVQCCRVPLFCKIIATKSHMLSLRYVNTQGQLANRNYLLRNSNELLGKPSGCLGAVTVSGNSCGECLISCYEGGIVVVVLGSAASQQKFADSDRLVLWLHSEDEGNTIYEKLQSRVGSPPSKQRKGSPIKRGESPLRKDTPPPL